MPSRHLPAHSLQGEGPLVTLLHCSLGSRQQWRALTRLLDADFRVLAPDLYGYGETPLPEPAQPFDLSREAALVRTLLDRVAPAGEPVHLVGHSYGGATALRLAWETPERVASLTLFEPVAFHLLAPDDPALLPMLAVRAEMERQAGRQRPDLAVACFIDYWNGPGAFAAASSKSRQHFCAGLGKLLLDFQGLLGDPLRLVDLRALTVPVQLLAGRASQPPALRVVEQLATTLPDCRLHWVSGGHMAPVSQAAEVNALIHQGLRPGSG
jgi:pimeloyl-ACP methyl ester carboxylesterase